MPMPDYRPPGWTQVDEHNFRGGQHVYDGIVRGEVRDAEAALWDVAISGPDAEPDRP
jgi:hypothetical protein